MVPVFAKAGVPVFDGASICCRKGCSKAGGTANGASIYCSKAGGTAEGASIYCSKSTRLMVQRMVPVFAVVRLMVQQMVPVFAAVSLVVTADSFCFCGKRPWQQMVSVFAATLHTFLYSPLCL